MRTPKYKRFFTFSIALYVIALFIPIFFGSDDIGAVGLALGLFGDDVYHHLPWLANFIYFTNLIIGRKHKITGILLSLIALTFGTLTIGIQDVLVHEGELKEPVTVGYGFFLWMLSFLTLLTGQLLNFKKSNDG